MLFRKFTKHIFNASISSKNIKTTEIKYDPNCLNSILTGQPETPRSIANTKEMLRFIDANCSYNQYRDVIWAIADTGWSCALELAKEWSLTAPHRFEESTLLTIFHSFNITRGIHYGTLVHHARKGGYDG